MNHLEEGRTSLLGKVEVLQEKEEETSQRMKTMEMESSERIRQLQEEAASSKLREQSLLTRIAELETQTVSIHQTDSTQESSCFFRWFFSFLF